MSNYLFYIFIFFLYQNISLADEVILYRNNSQVINYKEIAQKIKIGDDLIFSNNVSFRVKSILGAGKSSYIFETASGEALRISQYTDFLIVDNKQAYSLRAEDNYAYAIKQLSQSRLLFVPHIFRDKSNKYEYSIIENINVEFSLYDFINKQYNSSLSRRELEKRFIQFGVSTAEFETIRDFKSKNIIFNGKDWILLDFDPNPIFAKDIYSKSVFEASYEKRKFLFDISDNLRQKIEDAIIKERSKKKFKFIIDNIKPYDLMTGTANANTELDQDIFNDYKINPIDFELGDDEFNLKRMKQLIKKEDIKNRNKLYKYFYESVSKETLNTPKLLNDTTVFNIIKFNTIQNPYLYIHNKLKKEGRDLNDIIYFIKNIGSLNATPRANKLMQQYINDYIHLNGSIDTPRGEFNCFNIIKSLFK